MSGTLAPLATSLPDFMTTLEALSAWSIPAVIGLPLTAALVLALLPGWRWTRWLNAAASLATFLLALPLAWFRPAPGLLFQVDQLSVPFLLLATLIATSSSLFSAGYIGFELQGGRFRPQTMRFYHAMYQGLMAALNLALVANNVGFLWVAIELATLATVTMVGLYRTPAALEAAWKYFILAGVGVALALFGIITVYLAALGSLSEGWSALAWTNLVAHAAEFDPVLLNLAFVFLLLGFGTKAGLVPLHAWLPDAHAEGPTPITAVLSGLLINVSLYVILRFKIVLGGNPAVLPPGPVLVGIGLLTLLFGALMLYRRRDIKRLFAYSSIEHMGICAVAFGIGGPLANFAGLLQMMLHSLIKSGIFFAVGNVVQIKGSQNIAELRGLTVSHPALGWGLVLGVMAIAGLPPFGLFTSEFLLITSSFAQAPLVISTLMLGLLLAFGALLGHLNGIAFGTPTGSTAPPHAPVWPVYLHLGLALWAGLALPAPLVAWLQHAAALLGGPQP